MELKKLYWEDGNKYQGLIVEMSFKDPKITDTNGNQSDKSRLTVMLDKAPGKLGTLWRATNCTPWFAIIKLLTI